MRKVFVVIAALLTAFASAEFTPDWSHSWPATPNTVAQGGVVLSDGDLIVFAHDTNTAVSRVDAEQGRLWTVVLAGTLTDYTVGPGDVLYLAINDRRITRITSNGVQQWSQDLYANILDLAVDPVVGPLVLSGDPNIKMRKIAPDGQLTSAFGSAERGKEGKIISANEVYVFDGSDHDEPGGSWPVHFMRFSGQGDLFGSYTWYDEYYVPEDYQSFVIEHNVDQIGNAVGDYVPFRLVVTDHGPRQQGGTTRYLFPRSATGDAVEIKHHSTHDASITVEDANSYYELLPDAAGKWILRKATYDRATIWSRPVESLVNGHTSVHGATLMGGDLFWWGDVYDSGKYRPYLEKVTPDGRTVNTLVNAGHFVPGNGKFWLVSQDASAAQGGQVLARRFTPAPSANRDYYTTDSGSTFAVPAEGGVLWNDDFADGATAVLASQPQHGSVTLNADGGFTYTPEPGFQGFDNIEYYFVKNGVQSNTSVFAIAVGTFAYRHTFFPNTVVGGGSVIGHVRLSRPAGPGGFVVKLSSTSSAIEVPSEVLVPAGAYEVKYNAKTKGVDTDVQRSVVATGGYVPLHAFLNLQAARIDRLVLNENSFIYGGYKLFGRLYLNGKSGPSGGQIALQDNSDFIDTPQTVTLPPNATFVDFEAFSHPVKNKTLFIVTATWHNSVSKSFNILAPQAKYLSLSATDIDSGSMLTATVEWYGKTAEPTDFAFTYTGITGPAVVTAPANVDKLQIQVSAPSSWDAYSGTIKTSIWGENKIAQVHVRSIRLNTLSIQPSAVVSGASATATMQLSGPAPSSTAASVYSNSSSVEVPASVPIAQGATTISFPVKTKPVGTTTTRTLTAVVGNYTVKAPITLHANGLASLALSPATVFGGSSTTGTATLFNAASAATSVSLSDNSSSLATPTSVTIGAGSNSETFQVVTNPTGSTYTRQVYASLNGVTRTANLTVVPATLNSLTISPATVQGGQSATGTVRFNGKVASSSLVALGSNSSAVQTPANVLVQPGQGTATFAIKTSKVTATYTRSVGATYNGVTKTANITLTP